MSSFDRKKRKA